MISRATSNRVVITGMGSVNPLGNNVTESWSRCLEGQSGIDLITKFDTTGFDVTFAGEVKGFDADKYIDKKEQKKMDLFIHYALAATEMAIQQAELTEPLIGNSGAIIGVGMGGLPMIEEQIVRKNERGPSRISPFFIPSVITNLASGQVTIRYGMKGPNYSVTSACASGVHSMIDAYRMIRDGFVTTMVAGGAESTVCPMAVGGFAAMRALSTRNESPQTASRPWDKNRDGFVLAEGAGIFILESLDQAQARGAKILCEIVGVGMSSDAYHMTSPAPEGAGAVQAMEQALNWAQLAPEKVNYINAHGTSTPMGDGLEAQAIKKVFGTHASDVLVSSTKSMTGHALGAAGAIEAMFCIQTLVDQIAPPTINLEEPSEDFGMDFVKDKARKGTFEYVLNNSFGFGGTNACMIFKRWDS